MTCHFTVALEINARNDLGSRMGEGLIDEYFHPFLEFERCYISIAFLLNGPCLVFLIPYLRSGIQLPHRNMLVECGREI